MPNLLIEKMVYGGKGMGRLDKIIHFCPYVLPGEIVSIIPLNRKKNYIEALPNKLIKAAEKRVKPQCPYFTKCGGCDYEHIDYQEQINIKKNILIETFNRIGKINLVNIEAVPSNQLYNYRNRIQLKARNMKIGFYEKHSNKIIPIKSCAIAHSKINEIIAYLDQISQLFGKTPMDIHILSSSDNKCLLKVLFLEPKTSVENIIPIFVDTFRGIANGLIFYEKSNASLKETFLYGNNYMIETVNNISFHVNIDSFFQTNINQLKNILTIIIEYIKSHNFQKAADLYCGVGTFSIVISKFLKNIIAIESNTSAINDALKNAKANNCNNITFINKSIDKSLNLLNKDNCELIIVDPPRSGLNKIIIDCISNAAKAIIYIACDPSKQARDVKLLINNGFLLKKIILIDMFPHTYHIESICILEKHDNKK